jgi:hypothetical protein
MIKILPLVLEVPWLPAKAIPAWPLVLVRRRGSLPELRRLLIFARQQSELLLVPFLALFLWYWALRIWQSGSVTQSWFSVPFVREAAHNRDDPSYLVFRPLYAWRRYVDLE